MTSITITLLESTAALYAISVRLHFELCIQAGDTYALLHIIPICLDFTTDFTLSTLMIVVRLHCQKSKLFGIKSKETILSTCDNSLKFT